MRDLYVVSRAIDLNKNFPDACRWNVFSDHELLKLLNYLVMFMTTHFLQHMQYNNDVTQGWPTSDLVVFTITMLRMTAINNWLKRNKKLEMLTWT
jgi:hypothetical protein